MTSVQHRTAFDRGGEAKAALDWHLIYGPLAGDGRIEAYATLPPLAAFSVPSRRCTVFLAAFPWPSTALS